MEVRYKGLNEQSVSSGSSKRCTYELEMEVEKIQCSGKGEEWMSRQSYSMSKEYNFEKENNIGKFKELEF